MAATVRVGLFEWDSAKEADNIEKHGVTFREAILAFTDPNGLVKEDEEHSQQERRSFFYGKVGERILTVRFTARGECVRIIGAGYWRKGKKRYAER